MQWQRKKSRNRKPMNVVKVNGWRMHHVNLCKTRTLTDWGLKTIDYYYWEESKKKKCITKTVFYRLICMRFQHYGKFATTFSLLQFHVYIEKFPFFEIGSSEFITIIGWLCHGYWAWDNKRTEIQVKSLCPMATRKK